MKQQSACGLVSIWLSRLSLYSIFLSYIGLLLNTANIPVFQSSWWMCHQPYPHKKIPACSYIHNVVVFLESKYRVIYWLPLLTSIFFDLISIACSHMLHHMQVFENIFFYIFIQIVSISDNLENGTDRALWHVPESIFRAGIYCSSEFVVVI